MEFQFLLEPFCIVVQGHKPYFSQWLTIEMLSPVLMSSVISTCLMFATNRCQKDENLKVLYITWHIRAVGVGRRP